MRLVITLIACLLTGSAAAQEIQVLDGDTFILDGELVRLWGVDALEINQTCRHPRFDRDDPRGVTAFMVLDVFFEHAHDCAEVTTGGRGQTLVRCYGPLGNDIGRDLITQGLAHADPEHADTAYLEWQEEVDAIEDNGRGPVIYDCAPPWVRCSDAGLTAGSGSSRRATTRIRGREPAGSSSSRPRQC